MKVEHKDKANQDEVDLDKITSQFFDLFSNTNGKVPNLHDIKNIVVAEALIINNTSEDPAIYNLDSFMKPRVEILTNGTLTDFKEEEVDHQTVIYRNIAQRRCTYIKSGVLNGVPYQGGGKKLLQFIKVKNKWMLSAVIWSDSL